jgi:uncharacterized membrane protein YkvA (DUF1232 family)
MALRSLFRRLLSRKKDIDPDSVGPRGAQRYESRALDYLGDPDKTRWLLETANKKAEHRGALDAVWDDFQLLLRMIRSYVEGSYRKIPWGTILTATAAIVYFVVPTDFIPDFFIGLGLLDDAAVLAWTFSALKSSLDEFRQWEQGQPLAPDAAKSPD